MAVEEKKCGGEQKKLSFLPHSSEIVSVSDSDFGEKCGKN